MHQTWETSGRQPIIPRKLYRGIVVPLAHSNANLKNSILDDSQNP